MKGFLFILRTSEGDERVDWHPNILDRAEAEAYFKEAHPDDELLELINLAENPTAAAAIELMCRIIVRCVATTLRARA